MPAGLPADTVPVQIRSRIVPCRASPLTAFTHQHALFHPMTRWSNECRKRRTNLCTVSRSKAPTCSSSKTVKQNEIWPCSYLALRAKIHLPGCMRTCGGTSNGNCQLNVELLLTTLLAQAVV